MLTHDASGRLRRVGAVALGLLLAGCAGCAVHVGGSPIGTGQTVDPGGSASTSAPAPSAPSASATEPPADSDLPPAADGSDVSACFDGTCEVELRAPVTIPLDPATGIASLTLERVDGTNGAQLTGTTTGGGTISAQLYADPGGYATTSFNGFTIAALATVDGVAVLRLSPPA